MSVETKRIFHINDEATELNNLQLCVEDVVDPTTGFKMWSGKDGDGNITKWLALDKAARVTSLEATTGLSVTSGSTITATQVALACAGEIRFTDEHTNGAGSNWSTAYMPFSEADAEWLVARALLGDTEGSVLALIAAAAAYGADPDWDDIYDSGGAGGGRSAAVDAGPWLATIPVGGSTAAMRLVNNATGNTEGILEIENNATLSTGLAIDLSGDAGGDNYDYDEFGNKIWSNLGSVSMGHGYVSGSGYFRSYLQNMWAYDGAGGRTLAIARVASEYAEPTEGVVTANSYIDVAAGNSLEGYIDIYSNGNIDLVSDEFDIVSDVDITGDLRCTNLDFGPDPDSGSFGSGTLSVDFRSCPFAAVTIAADVTTFTIANPNGVGRGSVRILNSDSSSHTVVSPAGVTWRQPEDGSSGFTIAASESVNLSFQYWGSSIGWEVSMIRGA